MKSNTLHMIGHAHIDPVWLWQWHEGFHEVKATFRSALDRMNEYEEFVFVASSAAHYEWVEKSDPAMFAEIQRRVAEGRWQLVGGWWVEPDCNIPSGESFVRQGLYGQRYFQAKFGVMARVGFNVDSFGHTASLPQILLKSGLPYYVFMRPQPHEKTLPARIFRWESDDGSRVLAFRIPFEYLSWGKELDEHAKRCADEMSAPIDQMMCFYGVGNHGGGPTKANLDSIRHLQTAPDYPQIVCSSPEQFFAAVEAKNWTLPIIHSDLQRHATGCYAAHSTIKRLNRRSENALLAAEKWSSVAATVADQPYPDDFDRAWKSVLFNQFHDIMGGTSLEAAYDDAQNAFGEALSIADRNLNYAVQALAWNIRIEEQAGVHPMVVFNPHAWPVRANIELETNRIPDTAVLLDDEGNVVPHQAVRSASLTHRRRLSFTADLPALGYRTYRLRPTDGIPAQITTQATDTVLENEYLRLEFDPMSGSIASLYDIQQRRQVFAGAAAQAVVINDPSDTWGHNVIRFDERLGTFQDAHVKLIEHGAVKSVIRVTSRYGGSTLTQDFILYPGQRQVDVNAVVDWHEQSKLLKLRFPVNLNSARVTHEIPYGHFEQVANGDEVPFQSWVDVTAPDGTCGFSLLNDSKYSLDIDGADIGLTILRSPAYAHHIPAALDPDGLYSFIDQGVQRFSYTLLPHTGSWAAAGTIKRAAELNQRPFALFGTFHPHGKLPQSASFIEVDQPNIVVNAIKQAEDSRDIIVRAYETDKQATRARICLPAWNRVIEADFEPCAIKTFRLPADPSLPVVETNLLEL